MLLKHDGINLVQAFTNLLYTKLILSKLYPVLFRHALLTYEKK